MASLIKVDGNVIPIEPKHGKEFTLDELQAYVKGNIEIVYLKDGSMMVLNEEGKLIGLQFNPMATVLYELADMIVGDVLVCKPSEIS